LLCSFGQSSSGHVFRLRFSLEEKKASHLLFALRKGQWQLPAFGSSRDLGGASAYAFLREQIRRLVLLELCLALQPF